MGFSLGPQGFRLWSFTHRPLSSSFLGLPYRSLYVNHKNKELLRSPWVGLSFEAVDLGPCKAAG